MADISPVAASVVEGTGAQKVNGTSGATIVQGQPVYLDTSSNTYKLTDNNLSGAKTCNGISLNVASAGQPITVQTAGVINLGGAVMTLGVTYCASANAGMICPDSDVSGSKDKIILGVATSTSLLYLNIFNSGATVA